MKLLFLIPPYFNASDFLSSEINRYLPAFTIPYGVLSIEAYLKEQYSGAIEIRILDLNVTLQKYLEAGRTEDILKVFVSDIKEILNDFPADVIAISALFNSSIVYLQDLSNACVTLKPDVTVLAGGGLPSAAYEMILSRCPSIFAVCKGEGEIPLLDFINATDKKQLVLDHKAWICRDGLAAKKIPGHSFIVDLDTIPMLNYGMGDISDNSRYYNNRGIDKSYTAKHRQESAIHTSRGCPFHCVFCSNPSLHGRKVRAMSPDRVYSEVKRMRDDFGMTVLLLEDDHFFHDVPRAKEILRRLATLDIRIEFPNGVAVYAIDDEVSSLLSKAGVSVVALAIESGSDFVLNKIIKKPLKKRLIKPAVESLRRHNIKSHAFIVSGLPGEKDEHREETIDMLISTGFDWAHMFLAVPIYGSRLYDICIENGYIETPKNTEFIVTKSVIKTPDFDPKELEKFNYESQIRVNFIENYNIKIGRHDVALDYFKNVVEKYQDHALGHHCAATCYKALGQEEKALYHTEEYIRIVNNDQFWSDLSKKYGVFPM